MKNKENIKIAHLVLTVAIFVLSVISLKQINSNPLIRGPLAYIQVTLSLIALACGFGYLAIGSNKDARIYYKAYLFVVLITLIIQTINTISSGNLSVLYAIVLVLQIVFFVVLTVGKDLGKNLSYTLAGLTVVCAVIIAIISLMHMPSKDLLLSYVAKCATSIVLSNITVIMVLEKYADKDSRGAK